MQNKVTSYELSKQLADAGFDSKSHCGYWRFDDSDFKYVLVEAKNVDQIELDEGYYALIKAYDCFDLLMWLREEVPRETLWNPGFLLDISYGLFAAYKKGSKQPVVGGFDPQEALGQAVLKVVQGE